jgi:hypothetical protein
MAKRGFIMEGRRLQELQQRQGDLDFGWLG